MNVKRTASERLRMRADSIRNELRGIERKLTAMRAFVGFCNHDTPVAERIEALLGENPELSFSPAEMIEATGGKESIVRKSLVRLHTSGRISRLSFGRYWAKVTG